MFIWNFDPVAFHIGPFAIHWYGIVVFLGFVLGYIVLRIAAKNNVIPNLTVQLAEDYLLQLMMASVLMARLFYVVVYNPMYYLHHLLEIPAVWQGGLSIHGGLLGAIILTVYFCKKHNIHFYKLADLMVLPLTLGLVFGRLANFANSELYGRVTDVSWCVQFQGVGGCRHPSQLYEAGYTLVLFFILLAMRKSKRFVDGMIFWSFVFLYGLFRFLVTFYREFDATDPAILGFSIGQWLCILMMLAALIWLRAMKKTRHPLTKHK